MLKTMLRNKENILKWNKKTMLRNNEKIKKV